MISEKEKDIVNQYVDERYFDIDKIIRYLSIHDTVGNEIFKHSLKKKYIDDRRITGTLNWLDDEHGYCPLSVEIFLKRIPFYFYVADYDNHKVGDLGCILSGIYRDPGATTGIEDLYNILEYMFYECGLHLDMIFQYTIDQTKLVSQNDIFLNWYHYLKLCKEHGIEDWTPERFISSYNEVLEKCSLSPIIYEISDIDVNEIFRRNGPYIEFEGTFPCDKNGNPILKWIGLKIENAGEITCSCKGSMRGRLLVELKPNTMIYALNIYNNRDEIEDYWYQIYAGPQNMYFDFQAIRSAREHLKYTQKQVAEAVGASVRTYQKWEAGETTPDGHYLLRILNWLDLPDVQYVIRYSE